MTSRAKSSVWLTLAIVTVLGLPGIIQAKTIATTPVRIHIPRLKITASIQARGLTSRKVMLPPTTPTTVAWYNGGTIPGQPGTAIMYGHLTDTHFKPAIFSTLHNVHLKDSIIITDAHGTKYTFVVTSIKTFDAQKVTSTQLTPPTKFSHLTLYTCAGHWIAKIGKYSQYIVVYTTLQSVKKA